ncbi:hypothetical protein [Simiaoa sp.]|uniref:hypothetical protein n=1 Tax=Simiaoa sp. TaxID=2944202 RepID=UPI003F7DFBAD
MNHDIEKALDNLEKRAQDIQHYMNIMSKVKTVNVADDQDFQREFDFFYKVRRNTEWRKVFFEIFERKKKKNCSYKEIITELYEGTGQVEASFASKMLASIDENMPIFVRFVFVQRHNSTSLFPVRPERGEDEQTL